MITHKVNPNDSIDVAAHGLAFSLFIAKNAGWVKAEQALAIVRLAEYLDHKMSAGKVGETTDFYIPTLVELIESYADDESGYSPSADSVAARF